MTNEMLACCESHQIINVIRAAKAAWPDVMCFGIVFYDAPTSTFDYVVVPTGIFVHNHIYIS